MTEFELRFVNPKMKDPKWHNKKFCQFRLFQRETEMDHVS